MSSRHRTADSYSKTPSENQNGYSNNHNENIAEPFQGETSVKPNTNLT